MKKQYEFIILVMLFMPFLAISNVTALPTQEMDTSLQDILDTGTITVGIEAAYPPFELRDPITDEIVGFDPDIMGYIADDLGVTITWVDVGWEAIFTSLATGMFDCIISAVTITPEREETMDFSRWYFKSEQAVLVPVDSDIKTIEDIDSVDVYVGVQAGTTSDLYLIDNEIAAVKTSFATITLAIQALSLGTVDVVLGDKDTLIAGMGAYPGEFEVVDTFSPENFGIPVQTGFDSLRERINTILDELLGEDPDDPVASAFYSTTYLEWMGVEPTFVGESDDTSTNTTTTDTTTTDTTTTDTTDPTDDPAFAFDIPGYSLQSLLAVVSIVSVLLARKIRK